MFFLGPPVACFHALIYSYCLILSNFGYEEYDGFTCTAPEFEFYEFVIIYIDEKANIELSRLERVERQRTHADCLKPM